MANALQEAMSSIQQAGNKLATQSSGAGKNMMNMSFDQLLKQFQNLAQQIRKGPIKENRRGKNSIPVAASRAGSIVYADGTIEGPPEYRAISPMERQELNILRQNLIDQIPYTPEAAKMIKAAQMDTMGHRFVSSQENLAGGFAIPGSVHINRNALSYGGGMPEYGPAGASEVLAHELIHYLDDNLYRNSDKGGSVANSLGFSEKLKQQSPKDFQRIMKDKLSTKELYDSEDMRTRDLEMYAYKGQNGPGQFLKTPQVGGAYSKLYIPMSKNLNYSPKYPTAQTMIRESRMRPLKANQVWSQTIEENDI